MASSSGVAASPGSGDRNRVIGELTQGRDVADQVRLLLRQTAGLDPSASASALPALVAKIVDSFTRSISVLYAATVDSDDFSDAAPLPPLINSPASRKSEGSGDSCKTPKDRRGCHKRKRSSETWTKDSPTWPDDDHAWRKYGQKAILNAQHPRNYFRCTHKYDQGCPATKQVQKIQDDPPVFRAIYHAHHSCRTSSSSSSSSAPLHHHRQLMMDMGQDSAAIIWSFQQQQQSPPQQPIKQEHKSDSYPIQSSSPSSPTASDQHPPPPPHGGDYCFISDSPAVHTCTAPAPAPAPAQQLCTFSSGSDLGDVMSSDVYSCTASNHSMEMADMMTVGSPLDDFLEI